MVLAYRKEDPEFEPQPQDIKAQTKTTKQTNKNQWNIIVMKILLPSSIGKEIEITVCFWEKMLGRIYDVKKMYFL